MRADDRGFDRVGPVDWQVHMQVYRALGRIADTTAAERRAKEPGG